MLDHTTLFAVLDSLHIPVAFTDTDHIVRYMNRKAIARYKGGASLIGTSLFDCHNENSQKRLVELFADLQAGEDEICYLEEATRTVYIKAIRDPNGALLGYYEWFGPPPGK